MMKRSDQFKLFHQYFDAESERYENLNKRGSIYLSIISALTLFAGLKLEEIEKFISTLSDKFKIPIHKQKESSTIWCRRQIAANVCEMANWT